jgi:ribosome maturation factor RimP
MAKIDVTAALEGLVRPLAESHELVLWGIDFLPGQGRSQVRIFVDAPGGVTIDQCTRLSRDISVALDVEDPIPGRYALEVSSPGLDRLFFSPEQMAGYLGQDVDLALLEPSQGRKRLRGRLVAVDGTRIVIDEGAGELALDFSSVRRAQLRYAFSAADLRGKE